MALVQELGPLAVPHIQLSSSCGPCHAASWGRDWTSPATGAPFSCSVGCLLVGGSTSGRYDVPASSLSGQKMAVEKLWREFFSDPAQWWDHRSEKENPKHPDFKHKKTKQSLWLDNRWTPPWVEVELAAVTPGTLQSYIFSWNVRLRRYAEAGDYTKTLNLFQQMQQESMILDKFTFVPVLIACSALHLLEEGRRVHEQVIEKGYECDVFVGNCLVDMYSKCGSIEDAHRVFNALPIKDVIAWTAIITGYVKCGEGRKALELYGQMQQDDRVEPDAVTFVAVLNACASLGALEEGRGVHEQIIQGGHAFHAFVENSLVDMYAKCGSIEDARRVFNGIPSASVVSWNAMILGYVKCGQGQKALDLFLKMDAQGVESDATSYVGVLNACASVAALQQGRCLHEQIIRRGYESNIYVASSLVDMYAKCRSIEDALLVFHKMPSRDVVSWTTMILGYEKCGEGQKALDLYRQMQREGLKPTSVTFVAVLNACASVAALEKGRAVHKQIIDRGLEGDVFVASSLVDMYAKCGSIADARRVFYQMPSRNVVSWTAMLAGYAMHGQAKEALEHFERMRQGNVEVDSVTFVCLLSACSHGGFVEEGLYYFESMSQTYNISPTKEHYACVVDLLGRAGHLHKAEDLIRSMSCEPDAIVWISLLGACRVHGNMDMGERVAKRVLELEPGNFSSYLLLSNIYSAAGRTDIYSIIKDQNLLKGPVKQPGHTWIEVKDEVYSFVGNDKKHTQIEEIHMELERLSQQMKRVGYVPDVRFV